jgi:hypothetical protein
MNCQTVLLLFLFLVIGSAKPGLAGNGEFYPDRPGEWQHKTVFGAAPSFGLTSKQLSPFIDEMNLIASIVSAAKVFSPPLGFQARARSELFDIDCQNRSCAGQPARGRLEVVLYYFMEDDGKPAWGGEANSSFELRINDPFHPFGRRYSLWYDGLWLPDEREIFFSPQETGRIAGFPLYDNNLLVFTGKGHPAWIPVSREQYLTALIALRQGDLEKSEKNVAKLQNNSAYRSWSADRPERLKRYEAAYQQMKKINPVEAEKLREKVQQLEDEMEAQLNTGGESSGKDANKGLEILRNNITKMKKELVLMTSSERAAPAWILPHADALGSGLVPAHSSGGRLLVTANPDLFIGSRPATDIQMVSVLFDFSGLSNSHIGYKRLEESLYGIDWNRIATFVKMKAKYSNHKAY